jgi:hypothetical protein
VPLNWLVHGRAEVGGGSAREGVEGRCRHDFSSVMVLRLSYLLEVNLSGYSSKGLTTSTEPYLCPAERSSE